MYVDTNFAVQKYNELDIFQVLSRVPGIYLCFKYYVMLWEISIVPQTPAYIFPPPPELLSLIARSNGGNEV